MRDAPLQSEAERLSLDAASEIDAQARALMQRSTCLGYSKACRRVLAGDDFLSAAYAGDVARLAELCQRGHDIRLGQGGPLSPRGGAPAALAADDLAHRYHGDPAAVAQLEAHGQALELGQGRSSPLREEPGGRALAPRYPRPIADARQLLSGETLLLKLGSGPGAGRFADWVA
jgi:hypothetical protein